MTAVGDNLKAFATLISLPEHCGIGQWSKELRIPVLFLELRACFWRRNIQTQLWPMVHCHFFLFKMRLANLAEGKKKKMIQSTNSGSDTDYCAWSSLTLSAALSLKKLTHEWSKVTKPHFLSEFKFSDHFLRSHILLPEKQREGAPRYRHLIEQTLFGNSQNGSCVEDDNLLRVSKVLAIMCFPCTTLILWFVYF